MFKNQATSNNDIEEKKSFYKNVKSVLVYIILGISIGIGIANRQYSVINYESIIHEFDPWFNYRSTKYMVQNGFYKFLNWFDELSWYPLGRIVGTTVYPGLMYTSSIIYWFLNLIRLPVHIRDICVFLAPTFSGFTVIATYLFTKELWDEGSAVISAVFISIIPGYISRSVAGSYDNEGIAIFILIFTFFLWLKSLRLGSVAWASLTALTYCYMVTAWGGYVFIINIIPLHVFTLLVMGKYSPRLYTSYSTFYSLGLILSMQTAFVGYNALRTSEHIAALGVFGLLQIIAFLNFLKARTSARAYKDLFKIGACTLVSVGALFLVFLTMSGYVAPLSGRFYSLFDTGYAKIHLPIISSVSEHQPTTWTSFVMDFHCVSFLMLHGLYLCIQNYDESKTFAILYVVFATYFSGVMVRLILTLTPIVVSCAGISISTLLSNYFPLELRHGDSKPLISDTSEKKKNNVKIPLKKSKKSPRSSYVYYFASCVIIFIFLMLMHFVVHSTFITRSSYSSPSVVLSSQRNDGSLFIIDDFREAYYWLYRNTKPDAKILSWWDYGYQITGMANRTTIVDNNTWNNSHIALVGRAMASNESEAYKILQQLEVDYVLVIFGGMISFSGDDINKFLWMVRISQGEFPNHISEPDYFSESGQYTVGAQVSETMKNSLMYKMCFYNFGNIRLSNYHPPGFDTVRQEEIGYKNIAFETLEEAYTSQHWIVRIYKVKPPANRYTTKNKIRWAIRN